MNLPNKLTVSRFVLTAAFVGVILCEFPYHLSVALFLFSLASLTDWLDGSIARRRNLITDFGKLMDPLADKILTCSAFIAFVGRHYLPAWMVVLIVARELSITGLRLLAANKQVVLAAEGLGKHKTISQITTIIAILILFSYPEWGWLGQTLFGWGIFGEPWVVPFAAVSKWLTISLTVVSGALYLWRNRELYLSDM